ncbi:hypothetical protein PIB30_037884 [Stylosanthes scabra]|uniref:Transposase (Putative), gypsy type n=1 Tax=Stylosanthes scabra TaxID=79078 RepID=A0ABU6YB63_9FABA|nr:hypothetical protein [Stylosanthes scabra]
MAEIQGNDPGGVFREVEGAQMPHELNPLYDWVNRDVLGSPCTMTEDYLTELKNSGVIFGGGEEESHYRIKFPRPGERVCELNLEHSRVPHWLWVNEVMSTEFGVRILFSPFQQRLLQRCFAAPSLFHLNAWSAIRCFELVTEFLELPQDPEVFLYLFTVFSPNADGITKKGYMSVRPGKGRKIFGLYEESFHDFKGRYFKVFAIGDHPPFWLTLERDAGQFPSYWSKDAGVNYVPTAYRKLNEDQRDTADILLWLFSQRVWKPKAVSGNPERARATIVKMAGRNKTLANLRRAMVANSQGPITSVHPPVKRHPPLLKGVVLRKSRAAPGTVRRCLLLSERRCRSIRLRFLLRRLRWGREVLGKWRLLRSSLGSLRGRSEISVPWTDPLTPREKEKVEAKAAKSKAEKDLEAALADAKEKGVELQRLRDREAGLLVDLESAKKKLSEERSRVDQAKASLASTEQAHQELVTLAEDSVKATEDALKEQILVLAPDFDVSPLGACKEVVDGQIVHPPPES